uniref:Mitochondrial fission regulator n=1 Tax=Oncorhynchus mykiss TaxID=8022 RepID=A0A8C7TA50_ONCMY
MSKESPRIEMDLAFGFSGKAYGSSRSIVRRIATNLPLKPCPRVHFQLDPYTEDSSVLNSTGRRNGLLASLADVCWIDEEEKNDWFGFGRLRSETPSGLMFRSHPPQPKQQQPFPRRRSLPRLHKAEPEPQGQTCSNDEAIQKISALETELAKLRAQIAQIVLTQEQNALTPGMRERPQNTHTLKGKENYLSPFLCWVRFYFFHCNDVYLPEDGSFSWNNCQTNLYISYPQEDLPPQVALLHPASLHLPRRLLPLHPHSWGSSRASQSLTSSRSAVGRRLRARLCWTRGPSRQRFPICWTCSKTLAKSSCALPRDGQRRAKPNQESPQTLRLLSLMP